MNISLKTYKWASRDLKYRIIRFCERYKWLLERELSQIQSRISFLVRVLLSNTKLWTTHGRRFLELHYLTINFLMQKLQNDPRSAMFMAEQLLNVLKNCDIITYEEPGTAEAYVALHFIDRYHRFQLIFDSLHRQRIIPNPRRKIDILDVGTGPGPSMFAISDFYAGLDKKRTRKDTYDNENFSIDYVERSDKFRDWLHHFTEYVNGYCPSKKPWHVPFHHGSFFDFKGLEFNRQKSKWDYDDDGDRILINYIEKFRFDIIIFSNFLTTTRQIDEFSVELKNCVRFLRNNGILIVVGAQSTNKKYNEIYKRITKAILSENYNNKKFIAKCEKLNLEVPIMRYSWNDCYGEKVKELIRDIYKKLQLVNDCRIHQEVTNIIKKTIKSDYSNDIVWEVHLFRKKVKMREFK